MKNISIHRAHIKRGFGFNVKFTEEFWHKWYSKPIEKLLLWLEHRKISETQYITDTEIKVGK